MAGRFYAEVAQYGHDADLNREEQRLSDVGVYQTLGVDPGLDQLGNRPAERRSKRVIRLYDGGAEPGACAVDVAPHPGPLRAIAREHEGELAVAQRGSGDDSGIGRAGDEFAKRCHGFGDVIAKGDEALTVVVALARSRPQH